MKLALSCLVALGSTCATATPAVHAPVSEPASAGATLLAPEDRGPPLDATIPLYRRGSSTLAALRGRIVVLELFVPSEDQWAEAQEPWRALAQEHADRVTVVTIAVAVDDAPIVEDWDTDPPQHVVGWDPQGALALRLGVANLPMVLVLDPQGRVAARGQDRAAMLNAARALL